MEGKGGKGEGEEEELNFGDIKKYYLNSYIHYPVTKLKKGTHKQLILQFDYKSKTICYGKKGKFKKIIPFSLLSSISIPPGGGPTKRFHLHLRNDVPPYIFLLLFDSKLFRYFLTRILFSILIFYLWQ